MKARCLSHTRFRAALAVAAAAWLAAPTVSRASLIFDYSFSGTSSGPGTVTGEIVLPDNANNNTTTPTAVIIDTSTISFPFQLPYDTINDVHPVDSDSFTVTNGEITAADYTSGISGVYVLSISTSPIGELALENLETHMVISGTPPSGVTFTPVVPEPSALALLGTALAGLFLFRSANRRDRQIRPQHPETA